MKQAIAAILLSLLLASCGSNTSGDIQSDPERSFAHYFNLGLAAFEQKNYQEAVRYFKRSIELNPNISRTYLELGTTYLFLGDYENAAVSFERTLSLDPRQIDAHNSLGIAYLNLGRQREAEQHFNALLNEPEYTTPFIPLYNLGNLYYEKKDYRQALIYYMEALKEESKVTIDYRIVIHRQLGLVHYNMGKYEEAFEEFGQVLVLNPRDIESAFYGGMSAKNLGNADDARLMFSKVLLIDQNSPLAKEARTQLEELDK